MYRMCFVFFFQAEDGIRDLVRSRGLGDVYKRQMHMVVQFTTPFAHAKKIESDMGVLIDMLAAQPGAVSYTHLTLPTSDLV